MCLAKVYEKHLASQKGGWIKRMTLMVFSDNCGYSVCVPYQSLRGIVSSKVSCNVEYGMISVNLSISVIVKLIFLSCALDGPSHHASLCNTTHWPLGNTGSWYEAALPNVATPH